ncbi:MAG TPA: hypothetical protein VKQ08_12290, partial [Cyclobacteriaceae bacterium]|nr:hypothetical protein [Cyclobacteriaceae bacterium]
MNTDNSILNNLAESEKWVWQTLHNDEIADFNCYYNTSIVPASEAGWTSERALSGDFLRNLLISLEDTKTLPRRRIRIVGAWFKEGIDLSGWNISIEFSITQSRFEQNVCLAHMRTSNQVIFDHSYFARDLDCHSLQSSRSILLHAIRADQMVKMDEVVTTESVIFSGIQGVTIHLRAARISRDLNVEGGKLSNSLDMEGAVIGGNVLMGQYSEFKNIKMTCAEIAGNLRLQAKVSGVVDLYSVVVKQELDLADSTLNDLYVVAAHIGKQVFGTGLSVENKASFGALTVDGHFIMHNAKMGEINLINARIGGQFGITNTNISRHATLANLFVGTEMYLEKLTFDKSENIQIDLHGAQINGSLRLTGMKAQRLNLALVVINRNLKIENSTALEEVDLQFAQIHGIVTFSGIGIEKSLTMRNISVGGSFSIEQESMLYDIQFDNGKISSTLAISSSCVKGALNAQSFVVSGDVSLRQSVFTGELRIINSSLNGNLCSCCCQFGSLDLSGTVIRNELRLEEGNTWSDDSLLNLRNVTVSTFWDAGEKSWPQTLELE